MDTSSFLGFARSKSQSAFCQAVRFILGSVSISPHKQLLVARIQGNLCFPPSSSLFVLLNTQYGHCVNILSIAKMFAAALIRCQSCKNDTVHALSFDYLRIYQDC